ncbi:MAG TPA: hypothetical protein VLA51_04240 [Paracoccaceae bacterium]|nr:hypothetical protein [Paracoccaceae bacterium]
MAFADYIDLRTAVIEQSGRPEIADVFDRLTKLAEARFNRELRTQFQITEYTVTISNGTAYLPTDIAEVIGVYLENGYELTGQTLQMERGQLSRQFYSLAAPFLNGQDGQIVVQYYAKLDTLTQSLTTSNWLLEEYPDAYLYGVGVEAAKYLKDAEGLMALEQMRAQVVNEIRADDERRRYARARVRVKGPTP